MIKAKVNGSYIEIDSVRGVDVNGNVISIDLKEEGVINTPTQELNITANGTYDVTNAKIITVNVQGGGAAVTLESISATYNGGSALVGTSASDLDITVTGTYSDGSTRSISAYSITGTVAEGSNTFTITYNGKSTTVTVNGISSGGWNLWNPEEMLPRGSYDTSPTGCKNAGFGTLTVGEKIKFGIGVRNCATTGFISIREGDEYAVKYKPFTTSMVRPVFVWLDDNENVVAKNNTQTPIVSQIGDFISTTKYTAPANATKLVVQIGNVAATDLAWDAYPDVSADGCSAMVWDYTIHGEVAYTPYV